LPKIILTTPFNSKAVLEQKRKIKALELGMEELEELDKELFPTK